MQETTIIEDTPGAVLETHEGISMGATLPASPSRKQRRAQAADERHKAWKKLQRVLPTSGSRTLRRDFFQTLWNQGLNGE